MTGGWGREKRSLSSSAWNQRWRTEGERGWSDRRMRKTISKNEEDEDKDVCCCSEDILSVDSCKHWIRVNRSAEIHSVIWSLVIQSTFFFFSSRNSNIWTGYLLQKEQNCSWNIHVLRFLNTLGFISSLKMWGNVCRTNMRQKKQEEQDADHLLNVDPLTVVPIFKTNEKTTKIWPKKCRSVRMRRRMRRGDVLFLYILKQEYVIIMLECIDFLLKW